jgi:hypothetical protein
MPVKIGRWNGFSVTDGFVTALSNKIDFRSIFLAGNTSVTNLVLVRSADR